MFKNDKKETTVPEAVPQPIVPESVPQPIVPESVVPQPAPQPYQAQPAQQMPQPYQAQPYQAQPQQYQPYQAPAMVPQMPQQVYQAVPVQQPGLVAQSYGYPAAPAAPKSAKKWGIIAGIGGGIVVLIIILAIVFSGSGISGEKLLARADDYAASGNIEKAAADFEKYIEEDTSNPTGYLRLAKLYDKDAEKKADAYYRFVFCSGSDDEKDYVNAMEAMADIENYEGVKLANEKGMARIGVTDMLHPISFFEDIESIYVGQQVPIGINFPGDVEVPLKFDIKGSADTAANSDGYLCVLGKSGGKATLSATTPTGETFECNFTVTDFAKELIDEINKIRVSEKLKELNNLDKLQEAADIHAKEYKETGNYVTRPNGKQWYTVLSDVKLNCSTIQMLALPAQTLDYSPELYAITFMSQESVKKELLNKSYKNIGVGCEFDEDGKAYVIIFLHK